MAVLSLLMATACSNDDNDIAQQPAKAEGIPFNATISMGGNQTRALSDPDGDNKIQATWTSGEHVAMVYKVSGTTVVTDATVTAVDNGSGKMKGTISATLADGVTTGTPVTLIYPYSAVNTTGENIGKVKSDLFTGQNGLLTGDGSISATCDLRQGSGTITLATTPASLSSDVTMASQIAIWKLSLMNYEDGATNAYAITTKSLTIKDGSDNVLAATNASAIATSKSEFYMAVPAISSKDIKIEADYGDTYMLSKSGVTLAASTYYQSTAKLARPLSSAKVPYTMGGTKYPADVRKVVSADGRIFTTASAATDAGTSAVALICHVSSTGHGLALELNSSIGTANWSTACSNPTSKGAVPGGAWKLPTKQEWKDMLVKYVEADRMDSGVYGDTGLPIVDLRTKYESLGYSLPVDLYWSSTEYVGDLAWLVGLDSSTASFGTSGMGNDVVRVLACLAF